MTGSEADRSLFAQPQVTAVLAGDANNAVIPILEIARRNRPYVQSSRESAERPESGLPIGGLNGPFAVGSGRLLPLGEGELRGEANEHDACEPVEHNLRPIRL